MDTSAAVGRNPVTVERTSDREVVVTRLFDAPPHLVFEAWTRPELFSRWWAPRSMGMTVQVLEMDVRTGGRYRLSFGGDAEFLGTYVEVSPPTRLVWTNEEGGEDGSVTTVTFEEVDGGTRLVMSELFPTKEAFEAGSGAENATHETFAQLDDLLSELRGAPQHDR